MAASGLGLHFPRAPCCWAAFPVLTGCPHMAGTVLSSFCLVQSFLVFVCLWSQGLNSESPAHKHKWSHPLFRCMGVGAWCDLEGAFLSGFCSTGVCTILLFSFCI